MAVVGLCCFVLAFSSYGEWGLVFVVVCGLLLAEASLAVEHGLQAHRLQQLQHTGSVLVACRLLSTDSVAVVHRLSCFAARGIFLDQGSNLCPLHWQADSFPLHYREIQNCFFFFFFFYCFDILAMRYVVSQLPDQSLNSHPLHLEAEVLTIKLPRSPN